MRLPTFKVVDGVIDPISTGRDAFKLIGGGYPQPLADKRILGRDAIGYLGDCIYRTVTTELEIQTSAWSLELYAEIPGEVVVMATHDADVSSGGWYLTVYSSVVEIYNTRMYETSPYLYRAQYINIPESLRTVKPKLYNFVKEANKVKVYIDHIYVGALTIPSTSKTTQWSFFGLTRGKVDTYSSAGTLYCNYLSFNHGYAMQESEFVKFSESVTLDENLSFFNPSHVDPNAFDVGQLLEVHNFVKTLTAADYAKIQPVLPYFTTTTHAEYEATSSDSTSPNLPWRAFDASTSTYWSSTNSVSQKWLRVARLDGRPFPVNAFTVRNLFTTRGVPTDFTFQGKNATDIEWTDIYQVTNTGAPIELDNLHAGFATAKFSEYRLLIDDYLKVEPSSLSCYIVTFQLYYVEETAGNKAFEFESGEKEIILVEKSVETGDYVTGVTHSSQSFPRELTLQLKGGSSIVAGIQIEETVGYISEWGLGGGYLSKDAEGSYKLKDFTHTGFNTYQNGDATVFTYTRASLIEYAPANSPTFTKYTASGESIAAGVGLVLNKVNFVPKRLSPDVTLTDSKMLFKRGRYYLDGYLTISHYTVVTLQLRTVEGELLYQAPGLWSSSTETGALLIKTVLELTEDTEVEMFVLGSSASGVTSPAGTLLLPYKTLYLNASRM